MDDSGQALSSEPILDISIDTGDAHTDLTVTTLLQQLDAELLVRQTLHAVNIHQPVSLSLLVMDDTQIQALNSQFRQQDKPTDVLSFPLLEAPLVDAPAPYLWQTADPAEDAAPDPVQTARPLFVTPAELTTNLGDIAISWPTVERQALTANHAPSYEFLFLLCHGVLHLLGYDDQTEAGYTEMVRLQTAILHRQAEKAEA